MSEKAMIFGLIAKAMNKIGAIGKDSVNQQQKFKYRGIDAVYNALNPVMSELGLFICPDVIDHRREERVNTNGTVLKYSILTIKYTMFAPDGSNVSCTVVGEGMDSGDKASNKAMSVALKYACFQLFMIPTEEMVDPDAEVHVVTTPARTPQAPKQAQQVAKATVTQAQKIPQTAPQTAPQKAESTGNAVLDYLIEKRTELQTIREISSAENNALFNTQVKVMKAAGIVPNKPLENYTKAEAESLVNFMYTRFDPTGTVLKDDGEAS